ncbi:MAG: hypothetical protein ACD_57C00387G0004 [uncultured bacterium]|nr:MAG: hypothetical protein ACD_57C00387G0004 [uncultured bacterium]
METYSLALNTKRLYDSKSQVFSSNLLRDIFEINKESSFFSTINRLVKAGVLTKLEKNKYILSSSSISDFLIANFLYQPSYISVETALNFHGVLSQFPYEITSVTTKKTFKKNYERKRFSYLHIKNDLYWGFDKTNDSLIASPEKALLDQLHFASKGLRGFPSDEYDLSTIDSGKLKEYAGHFPKTRQFLKLLKELKL